MPTREPSTSWVRKNKRLSRLGGLYALEKIAHANESYHRQIMEVLCAFIRLTAGPAGAGPSEEKVKSTVQTALTILRRRNSSFDEFQKTPGYFELVKSLKNVRDLIYGKPLQNSVFKIDLSGIKLCNANLIAAYLSEANLIGANLSGAYLSGAYLSGAYLIEANLSGAKLSGADLRGANLDKADLSKADLSGAKVTLEQLQAARVYTNTILPKHIDLESLDLEGPFT